MSHWDEDNSDSFDTCWPAYENGRKGGEIAGSRKERAEIRNIVIEVIQDAKDWADEYGKIDIDEVLKQLLKRIDARGV